MHQISDVWGAFLRSPCYCYSLPSEIRGRQETQGVNYKSSRQKNLLGYVVWLRHVEKQQKTIDTAVPFNHAFIILGFLADKYGKLQILYPLFTTFFKSQECCKWRFRENRSCAKDTGQSAAFHTIAVAQTPFLQFLDPPLLVYLTLGIKGKV